MPSEKIILYLVFAAIFILSRLFRQKKDENQDRPHLPPPERPTVQTQPPYKKEKSLLETIIEEVNRQKELNKPRPPEIKQKTYKPEKKPTPKKPAEFLSFQRVEQTEPIDHLEKEEGISSIPEKYKRLSLLEESEQERKFDFDPREAFMMTTLFERPYS